MQRLNHEDYGVPKAVWDFFSEEKGLSTDQLIKMDRFKRHWSCYLIDAFSSCTFDLIKFYRDNPGPGFSIDDLLKYNGYAIRDLAVDDKNHEFKRWFIKNELRIPEALTKSRWGTIDTLCNEAGIEYLNREVLTLSKAEQQAKLESIIERDRCQLGRDIEKALEDVLAHPNEAIGDTTAHRFKAFKEKHSLSQLVTTKGIFKLDTVSLSANTNAIVKQTELKASPR